MSEGFTCGACGGGNGRLVLDLGMQPLANNLLTPEDLDQPEPQFPLRLFVCRDCWLLQLVDRVPPVTLFTEYPYYSSVSDTFRRHVTAAAERHRTELGLNGDSLVLEIASNDGCFLAAFQEAGIPVLGIEPAANVARAAQAQGIETLVEFFGLEPGRRLARQGRRADLVLGNNVLAHAPELVGFVSGLREVLRPGGRIVLEFPYAIDFLERAEPAGRFVPAPGFVRHARRTPADPWWVRANLGGARRRGGGREFRGGVVTIGNGAGLVG
jgi:SAM-dependent methyltransferase